MESLTIRVSRSTFELLRALAARSKTTITAVVDEAVRDLQRKQFWADFHASCAALKAGSGAAADLRQEDAAWETTLADCLDRLSLGHDDQRRKPYPQ